MRRYRDPKNIDVDAIVTAASMTPTSAKLDHVLALAEEVHRLRRKLGQWMDYVPEGGEPVEAYTYKGELIVCGDPVDVGEVDEHPHDCDVMGCSSLSHVIFRQKVQFT